MRTIVRHALCLLALTMNAAGVAAATNAAIATSGTPEGFSELETARISVVDLYFGNQKIGEASAVTEPGLLRFRSPDEVLAKIPQLIVTPEVRASLAGELPTNSRAACSYSNAGDCGVLRPDTVAIIYDEDRFRVDVFVNPKFLKTSHLNAEGFLPNPVAPLSLTNAVGLNASGTVGGGGIYNLQNRTIIGLRNARLRANTSIASRLGLIVDDLVAEVDHKDLRFSGGLFWVPGNEFTGQRRMIGLGVGTQFDTSADREALRGTPLILFLAQPARVELVVDGRLASSRSYPAGNNDIDTSALSDGSYSVVLRIHQANGAVREERRFFVKNAQIPPASHPIFYGYAGMLANTADHRPVSVSRTFYYQAGAAWRLTNNVAVDVAALGTQQKVMFQAGGWFIKGPVRLRAAALASSAGDAGALLQVSTGGHGPLNVNFDLRRIWSHDGQPLIPLPRYANTFDEVAPTGIQLANGSYTQATGSIGLRVGRGYLSVVGSYRKDDRIRADYTIGPSITYPVITRNALQVVLEASAQKTRTTTAGFAGVRVQFTSGRMSMLSTLGRSFQNLSDGPDVSRSVTNFTAQYSHETDGQTQLNVEGGIDRNITSSTAHAGTTVDSRFGNLRADLLHNLKGGGGTLYDVAFQSGMALGGHAAAWGARSTEPSAIIVSVGGDAADTFKVLVDEVVLGRLKSGQRLPLFLPAYRTYRVRLVPAAASPVSYDAAAREVTLYPGNVQSLRWNAESYFTIFAQATTVGGLPISNALVRTAKTVAQTDAKGYFQIDVRHADRITIAGSDSRSCQVSLGNFIVKNDFASIGKVICQ